MIQYGKRCGMNQIFEKIINELHEKISESAFEKNKISDFCFEFKNSEVCYTVEYKAPCLVLSKNGEKLCEWLLNENSSKKYIGEIVSDFSDTIGKKKLVSPAKRLEKNIQKEVTIDKMAEKLMHFFPNFRESYNSTQKISEKISFFGDKIIPEINKMISKNKDENKVERMLSNLCNDYVFGDLNTRCVITMLFFRGINGKENRKKARRFLPNYMKKTWDATLRMKNT